MRGRLWVGAERGFSLIELIGVLAIMGILASMTVPPILRQIRQAQTVNEDANLNEVARAIVEGIKVTGTIPNPNVNALFAGGWASNSLPYTALGTNQLLYVTGTSVDQQRRMYLSGGLEGYCAANGGYSTPTNGWSTNAFPADLQLALVSSSREDLLLNCPAVGNLASGDVVWLKNWVKQATNGIYFATNTAVVGSIANSTGTWTNKGEFLHVKVVDLKPLFCRVELTDFASPINAAVTVAGGGVGAAAYVSAAVVGNQLGYDFRFNTTIIGSGVGAYLGLATGNVGNVCGSTKQLITRPYVAPAAGNLNDPATTTEAPIAEFQLNLPSPPYWVITPPGLSGSGNSMPATSNTSAFYVIKGTSLSLYSTTAPPPADPILTVQINSDCAFEYFNGSWTQRN
jgi:prepilin-type N-terminal cleavage/methylation domain-containing protein